MDTYSLLLLLQGHCHGILFGHSLFSLFSRKLLSTRLLLRSLKQLQQQLRSELVLFFKILSTQNRTQFLHGRGNPVWWAPASFCFLFPPPLLLLLSASHGYFQNCLVFPGSGLGLFIPGIFRFQISTWLLSLNLVFVPRSLHSQRGLCWACHLNRSPRQSLPSGLDLFSSLLYIEHCIVMVSFPPLLKQ